MFAPSLKEIFAVAAKLPAAPQVLAELGVLLEDMNADTDEVARLLRRDGPLAASVLRISNSIYYGSGGVGSIEAAVNRVGFGEVQHLVGCAAVGVLADCALSFYEIEAEPLRQHMVCSALACETLAAYTHFDSRKAYTAGLLRLIGMMVLDRMARTALSVPEAFDLERDGTYAVWESRALQIRNAAVTAVVLSEWRFPEDVVEAVRGHSLTPGAKEPTQGAGLLNIAGWVVEQLGLGLAGERELWELTPQKLKLAGLREEQVKSCVERVESQLSEMQALMH
jgi:HD-like signal output (HDOD) protein